MHYLSHYAHCPVDWVRRCERLGPSNQARLQRGEDGRGRTSDVSCFILFLRCFSDVSTIVQTAPEIPRNTSFTRLDVTILICTTTFAMSPLEAPLQPLEQQTRLHGWAVNCVEVVC